MQAPPFMKTYSSKSDTLNTKTVFDNKVCDKISRKNSNNLLDEGVNRALSARPQGSKGTKQPSSSQHEGIR